MSVVDEILAAIPPAGDPTEPVDCPRCHERVRIAAECERAEQHDLCWPCASAVLDELLAAARSAFDVARHNDRRYKAPPPWNEWDDYAGCWVCRGCGAASGYQVHNPGCRR